MNHSEALPVHEATRKELVLSKAEEEGLPAVIETDQMETVHRGIVVSDCQQQNEQMDDNVK